MQNIHYFVLAIFMTLLILQFSGLEGMTSDAVGQGIQNESEQLNMQAIDKTSVWNEWDPYRSDLSYGTVIQDPFIREDGSGIPQLYYNRHLTEKNLQDIDYVPRRIRPPHGPVFWENPPSNPSPLKAELAGANIPLSQRVIMARKLNMPSEFY